MNKGKMQYVSAEEALKVVKSRDNIYIQAVAAAPRKLVEALANRGDELKGVNIFHLHTEGPAPYADKKYEEAFHIKALFVGSNVRDAVQTSRGSYIPIFLSEVPILFAERIIPLDVVLITVSPPGPHGYCTLGTSVEAVRAAIKSAKTVIAQVNDFMPRTHGDTFVHVSEIDYLVEYSYPIPEVLPMEITPIEKSIGKHISGLVEDGATLQLGIGGIPNAVLRFLDGHKDLGIHTELFSDGIIPLVEKGIINGKNKPKHKGKIVSTIVMGSRKLYDFVNNNPLIRLLDCDYVNSTHNIRQYPKMTTINSAIEIDLTGQVCADSFGSSIFSGVGGQMDFVRGASLSKGGKPIIALPSATRKGHTRIVSRLREGAGVVTTRAHVQYVVTENGIVNLYGKSIEERCRLLISIAHPDHREHLAQEAYSIYKVRV
jgi:4-hydroxybutyrate CoA-transferase